MLKDLSDQLKRKRAELTRLQEEVRLAERDLIQHLTTSLPPDLVKFFADDLLIETLVENGKLSFFYPSSTIQEYGFQDLADMEYRLAPLKRVWKDVVEVRIHLTGTSLTESKRELLLMLTTESKRELLLMLTLV